MRRALIAVMVFGVLSCSDGGGGGGEDAPTAKPDEQPVEPDVTDENGKVTATIDGTTAQLVNASGDGGLAGTSVQFPAGAVQIQTSISVQEGATLPVATLKGELNIPQDVDVTPASGTLLIASSEAIDLSVPAQVSMPYNPPAELLDSGKKPALLYHIVRQDQGGGTYVGIDAATAITVADGRATFSISYFGAYVIVLVPVDFATVTSAPSSRPLPVPKSEEKAEPDPTQPVAAEPLKLLSSKPTGTVGRPGKIEATFNMPVKPLSAIGMTVTAAGGDPVDGNVSVNGATVTFTPRRSLAIGADITVTFPKDKLQSTGGAKLAADAGFSFKVKDGTWAAATSTDTSLPSGMPTVVSLNDGRFGLGLSMGSGSTTMQLKVYDGKAWGETEDKDFGNTKNVIRFTMAGGMDGNLYVSTTLGQGTQSTLIDRRRPPLASPVTISNGTYIGLELAALGEGKSLTMVHNTDSSVDAYVLGSTTVGSAEHALPVPASGGYRNSYVLASSPDGATAAYGVTEHGGQGWSFLVYKRTGNGTWTSLTPNGNELAQDANEPSFTVSVDKLGRITALSCLDFVCSARVHDGTGWSAAATLTTGSGSDSFTISPEFISDVSGRGLLFWARHISDVASNKVEAARFDGSAWSAIAQLDSDADPFYSLNAAIDDAGRVHAAWIKGQTLLAARLVGSNWSAPAPLMAMMPNSYTSFALTSDPSGEAMLAWSYGGSLYSYIFH